MSSRRGCKFPRTDKNRNALSKNMTLGGILCVLHKSLNISSDDAFDMKICDALNLAIKCVEDFENDKIKEMLK